jgi:hypothetical protein
MDPELVPYSIFALMLLVPAIVVFAWLMLFRRRRGKFHRQRITKRRSKKKA